MKQVFNSPRTGDSYLEEVPVPARSHGSVLIRTTRSLISSGTERTTVTGSQKSLLKRALDNPEKVLMLAKKVLSDGFSSTAEMVNDALSEPTPLGYCNVGVVVEADASSRQFLPGTRVVSNGNHAEYVSIGANLCCPIPANVTDEVAAFTVLGAIGLEGIRLANPTLGETVFVMGLGLIGQLTAQMLLANGCRVIGSDFHRGRLELAKSIGVETVDLSAGENPVDAAMAFSRGRGVDAVILTAATESNDPVLQAARMSRKRGRIVLVGVTGMELSRDEFFAKELTFQVSCSYGPGRYDPTYELQGQDYPAGFVRWTEGRNFEAVLDLFACGKLNVDAFITHRFPIEQVGAAYQTLTNDSEAIGIMLEYPEWNRAVPIEVKRTINTGAAVASGACKVGMIGAGDFARATILPALSEAGFAPVSISSSKGVTSAVVAKKYKFARMGSDSQAVISDPEVNSVFVMTRHDSHAKYVCDALAAGKHVFVEKPLAINLDGLKRVAEQFQSSGTGKLVLTGFNRRFSPHAEQLRKSCQHRVGPLCLSYVLNAGKNPPSAWTQDPLVGGGRIVGEGCHFLDLMRFVVGSPMVTIHATMVGRSPEGIPDDKMTITVTYEDGSIGTLHYFGNGGSGFPKEQLFAFWDGNTAYLNDFKETTCVGPAKFSPVKTPKVDKGHKSEIARFVAAVSTGGTSPIPFEEQLEVTLATFAAVHSARSGTVEQLAEWRSRLQ